MFILMVVFIIMLFSYIIIKANRNTRNAMINKIQLNPSPGNHSGPALNILHLSDLHLENISISPEQLYEKVKSENIDLIALTGDFLDRKRSIPKLIPYLEMFKTLNAKYGTYAVFGNHDYVLRKENFKKLESTLENNGIITMRNETKTVILEDGQKLNIIGIDDYSTKRSDLKASYKDVTDGYNLVLTHDPNLVLEMKDYHFDYLLSGHFHGGQIHWPKPYHLVKMGKLVRMNMVKGLHYHDGKAFYISEGLGQTGVNIRIGSLPEITFHNLHIPTEKTSASGAI